jgi:hypothetical protein
MKYLFLYAAFVLTLNSCQPDRIAEIRVKACNCFDSITYNGDRLKFQMAEQRCMTRLYNDILAVQQYYPDKSNLELDSLLQKELKEKCKSCNEVLTLYFQLSKQSTVTKITDKSKCEILKSGRFKECDGEKTFFTIQDSLSVTSNLTNGSYTKSKIKWIDSCTYKLIPFETTDSTVKRHLKENPVFTIKIIDIIKDTVTYEFEFMGDYSLGQFVKIN